MVVEDSCRPSDALTPQRVYDELQKKQKALWLASMMQPRMYNQNLGDTGVSALAKAENKCLCGENTFWQNVGTLFNTVEKNGSVASVFQMMAKLGELDLVYPLLGATMPHISQRTRQIDYHSLDTSGIDGDLLPLPPVWEQYLLSMWYGTTEIVFVSWYRFVSCPCLCKACDIPRVHSAYSSVNDPLCTQSLHGVYSSAKIPLHTQSLHGGLDCALQF